MPFEEFTHKNRASSKEPMISLLKQGNIGVNDACYKRYLKGFKFVILYYDAKNKRIGLKMTNTAGSTTYEIRRAENKTVCQISGTAFLNHYNILHKETKAYTCTFDKEQEILIIQLDQ